MPEAKWRHGNAEKQLRRRNLREREAGEKEAVYVAKGKYQQWITPEGLTRLKGWATDGLTDAQIAKNVGCNVATLYEWKNRYSEIAEALKKGKDAADREVENALFRSALGYEAVEEVEERVVDEKTGEAKLVVTKRTHKHIPANTTAQIFWLKNRKPDMWRDCRDVELSGKVDANPFANLTEEQLRRLGDGM